MKIRAFDPGGSTGVCELDTETMEFGFWTYGPEDHHQAVYDDIYVLPPDLVICERFLNRGNVAAKLISGEYVGIIRLVCLQMDIPVELHVPDQKTWWNDSKLKRIGLWHGGTVHRHERDALRHVLYYMTFKVGDDTWVRRLSG